MDNSPETSSSKEHREQDQQNNQTKSEALDSSVLEDGFVDVGKRYLPSNLEHQERSEPSATQNEISDDINAEQSGSVETQNPREFSNPKDGSVEGDFTVIEQHVPEGVSETADRFASISDLSTEKKDACENVQLPMEYAKRLVALQCDSYADGGVCDVYLVGTAHVSLDSCKEVEAVIRYIRPEVVFLELCEQRISLLTPQNLQVPTFNEMVDMWKKRKMNAFGIIYSWFLAKVAAKLEVFPGSEFRCAYETAMEYGGKVILGDRPVEITLRRTWAKMGAWHKLKFFFSMFFQAILLPSPEELEKLMQETQDVDAVTLMIQEMSKSFPTLIETLLYERDLYMSSKLLKVAREHSSVVAVVGRGHLAGIEKHWNKPISVASLLEVPVAKSQTSSIKFWTTVSLAIGGIAITTGLFLTRKK
eukprot:TRINITY_DN449_c0_g1_i1.p1 TRINITY_DN449_c0_g1~~TRINITY_DN449_c0_g1_i1.p1  ORF type:complete len:479 (+),score=81.50 TRINITY_DN449_c0_g1_i1:183-1439(+)